MTSVNSLLMGRVEAIDDRLSEGRNIHIEGVQFTHYKLPDDRAKSPVERLI